MFSLNEKTHTQTNESYQNNTQNQTKNDKRNKNKSILSYFTMINWNNQQ